MIICNKISDLIGELWITCQVITHGWLMARTHLLNITGSNALHDLFLFSIHEAMLFFFFQAEDGIRDLTVTGVQTCALPICLPDRGSSQGPADDALWCLQ